MRAKDIVKATKEYERLQGLIDNIEKAFLDLERIETQTEVETNGFLLTGYTISIDDNIIQINPSLNKEATALIRSDLKELFNKHLYALRAKQENLVVFDQTRTDPPGPGCGDYR